MKLKEGNGLGQSQTQEQDGKEWIKSSPEEKEFEVLVRSLTWTGSVCLQLRKPTVPWTASKAVWPEGGGDDCPHLLCSYKASPAALHSGVQCCTCNFTKFFSCRAASILASISYLQYMVKVISSYSLGMLQLQYTEGWSFQILYRYRPVNKTIIYIYKHS